MSTQIQHYQFHTNQLRAMPDEQGESWFIAKDVCDILGYSNSARTINDLCRKSGIRNTYLPMFSANYKMIDEGNLYRLIIKSNKPESEPFESWVCDEVLPSIRKTGSYQTLATLDHKQAQQFEALKRYALRGNPVWQAISRYKAMGLNHVEIGKLVGINVATVRRQVRSMEASGLLATPTQLDLLVQGAQGGVA